VLLLLLLLLRAFDVGFFKVEPMLLACVEPTAATTDVLVTAVSAMLRRGGAAAACSGFVAAAAASPDCGLDTAARCSMLPLTTWLKPSACCFETVPCSAAPT